MGALRIHAAGELRVEAPGDLGEPGLHGVLLQNRVSGICATDLHEYRCSMESATFRVRASNPRRSRCVTSRQPK
jgi:threonine dehydrogenase-like Zn-dependent dehydrogenase